MQTTSPDLLTYLEVNHHSKRWARDRLLEVLSSGRSFPSFSTVVLKLVHLAQDDDVAMKDLVALISKEPGLAANCIRVASTSRFSQGPVSSVADAVMRLGTREIRRIAGSLGVMSRFNHLRVSVDWERFWLHSLLVARLSEQIESAFRQSNGMGYMAGLLHDSGKLVIEHHLPREFETVMERAWSRKCGHFTAERDVLGVDHAQIGAALCHSLRIHHHVRTAVWFHHSPTDPRLSTMLCGDHGFLGAVVGFADALAHMASDGIGGERVITTAYDELPEWKILQGFDPINGLELDTERDLAEAEADLKAFAS